MDAKYKGFTVNQHIFHICKTDNMKYDSTRKHFLCNVPKTSFYYSLRATPLSSAFSFIDTCGGTGMFGLNIFYSEEKDWARDTTRQCPLQNWNVSHVSRI